MAEASLETGGQVVAAAGALLAAGAALALLAERLRPGDPGEMRRALDKLGGRFGSAKTEARSEWGHVN